MSVTFSLLMLLTILYSEDVLVAEGRIIME